VDGIDEKKVGRDEQSSGPRQTPNSEVYMPSVPKKPRPRKRLIAKMTFKLRILRGVHFLNGERTPVFLDIDDEEIVIGYEPDWTPADLIIAGFRAGTIAARHVREPLMASS